MNQKRAIQMSYAHSVVYYAVKIGQLKRELCEVCGKGGKTHGHHDDYSKPLKVRWLCAEHHRALHRLLSRKAQAAGFTRSGYIERLIADERSGHAQH